MYRAYGLLQPNCDYTTAAAVKRLRAEFPTYSVAAAGERVTVSKGDWGIELLLNADPSVRTEASALAEQIAGLEAADAATIEECNRRVDVWSDTPDPFVEHLADFHAVVGVLKTFRGLIAIDPHAPALM